jgi:RecB family endonuclease NucS
MNLEQYENIPTFLLYLDAEISYDGRASSTLIRGNYLIIKKQDGSLLVLGANHVPALNYMGSGSVVRIDGDMIIVTRRSETIKIKVYGCHKSFQLEGWSNNKIEIRKTEAELTDKIATDPEKYLGPGAYTAYKEYPTAAGPIDLVLTSSDIYIIEVKRNKITLKDCYQVQRYIDAFLKLEVVEKKDFGLEQDCSVIACLAGPAISSNAKSHCDDNHIRYLPVDFEE